MSFDFRLPNAISTHTAAKQTSLGQSHPYQSSISSSASSSASSVFSADSGSARSTVSNTSWEDNEPSRASACRNIELPTTAKLILPPIRNTEAVLPADQRQHPRRCPAAANQRPPPALIRQTDRKCQFVDSLVDCATQMVEVIWPLSTPTCPKAGSSVLPLRTFIQETLRRSRTSFSTLQVALYYLILVKAYVPKYDFTMEQPEDMPSRRALQCGRRMFLAALILASKYLQDHNYSARAWSKISGLKVCEINCNEMAFLTAVNWRLHFPEPLFERWQDVVMHYCQQPPSPSSSPAATWKSVIPRLTPALDTVDVAPRTPVAKVVAGPAPLSTNMYTVPDNTNACFKIARYLEPKAEPLPPTPALTRMGPLPTPQLTPQASVACTPAARTVTCGPRQSSMCSAMAQVNRTTLSRSVTDSWTPRASDLEQYRISSGRRPSVAISTTSSSSSPESMVSDMSSRTSRSSSISSASSGYSMGATTTTPVKLCRLATLRNAGLPYSMPLKEAIPESVSSEPISSPDFESLSFRDVSPSEYLPLRKVRTEPTSNSATKGRKRGRSSVDIHLQQNVRNLLRTDSYSSMPSVITDTDVADSFLLDSTTSSRCATPRSNADGKALQSPARSVSERRLPVQKESGRKRACCASEARGGIMRFEGGPGMWDGVL